MDIALKKLDLIERLMLVWDEEALQRIATVIEESLPADDDFTDEELAELDRRRERHLRGEGVSYTLEESMARLREARK